MSRPRGLGCGIVERRFPLPGEPPCKNPIEEFLPQEGENPHVGGPPLDAWDWAERISLIGLFVLAVCYTALVTEGDIGSGYPRRGRRRHSEASGRTGGRSRCTEDRCGHRRRAGGAPDLLCLIGLLSTPFTYWIGRTTELASLIEEKLKLLSDPLAFFDAIDQALTNSPAGHRSISPSLQHLVDCSVDPRNAHSHRN